MTVLTKEHRRLKRRRRVRAKVSGTAERPRDVRVPLQPRASPPSSSTTSPAARSPPSAWFEPELRALQKAERAKRAGELLAERAKAANVSQAVFDRGGYRYHGHVRAFAEAIREAGITV